MCEKKTFIIKHKAASIDNNTKCEVKSAVYNFLATYAMGVTADPFYIR